MSVLLLALLACAPKTPPAPAAAPEPAVEAPALNAEAVRGVEDPALRQLLSDHWEATMEASPEWATRLGDHRFDDRLSDPSEAAREAWRARVVDWLERAGALDPVSLSEADRLTLELFVLELRDQQASEVCRFAHWSVGPRGNALTAVNGIPEALEVHTPADGANLLARYRAAPATVDARIANLRLGLADGLVANAHSVELILEMLDTELAKELDDWTLLDPTEAAHPEWDREAVDAWRKDLRAAVEEGIRPALERYRTFLAEELLPEARPQDATGVGALPLDGCYDARVRSFTTLERTPEEVHQQGLDALEGIHDEFRALGQTLWGTTDLAEIFERLRTDPELRFDSPEAIVAKADSALDAARTAMPEAFGRLPEAACVVEPIPDYAAPYTTVAYYQQPTPGERPGTYFVNTWEPETRPAHEAEVLAFHESIPGHHLQIAISQELPDVPAFRRHMGFTAFVEGWALYVERLSDELGLYSGDVDRMGMLAFDAWRASRLVVDTGLHDQGWTREEAVAFFETNTPLARNNIANEVDRYITWPGQAVAYKTGQLEIRALRAEAEAALGDDFDLAAFHDVVLGAGAVPLPVLRRRVEAWVTSLRSEPSAP